MTFRPFSSQHSRTTAHIDQRVYRSKVRSVCAKGSLDSAGRCRPLDVSCCIFSYQALLIPFYSAYQQYGPSWDKISRIVERNETDCRVRYTNHLQIKHTRKRGARCIHSALTGVADTPSLQVSGRPRKKTLCTEPSPRSAPHLKSPSRRRRTSRSRGPPSLPKWADRETRWNVVRSGALYGELQSRFANCSRLSGSIKCCQRSLLVTRRPWRNLRALL